MISVLNVCAAEAIGTKTLRRLTIRIFFHVVREIIESSAVRCRMYVKSCFGGKQLRREGKPSANSARLSTPTARSQDRRSHQTLPCNWDGSIPPAEAISLAGYNSYDLDYDASGTRIDKPVEPQQTAGPAASEFLPP